MGIRSLAQALYDHHGLDPTAKLVLVAIADHINDETGVAWPSLTRLAHMCCIHPRSVMRWVEHLEQAGHLEVIRRPGWANHYRLITRDTHVTGDTYVTRDTHVRGPVTPASKTSDTGVTQTRRTRREPRARVTDAPTPTPPPLAVVLAQQDQYR